MLEAPGPPVARFSGHLRELQEDPLAALWQGFQNYGDVCRFRLGWVPVFLLAHPNSVRHVLVSRATNYDKNVYGYHLLKNLFGNGLITSEKQLWQHQRDTARPALTREKIIGLAPIIAELVDEQANAWAAIAQAGRTTDVCRDMMRLTLRISCRCLVGTEVEPSIPEVEEAIEVHLDDYRRRLFAPYQPPEWWPTRHSLSLRKARKTLRRFTRRVVEQRRASPHIHDDLLTAMLAARYRRGADAGSENTLSDELLTILLASHETTANALTFLFYLLARHPQTTHTLRDEMRKIGDHRVPHLEDLPRLTHLVPVIKESMRLFPPAWAITRRATVDDIVGGYRIPRGSIVVLSAYVTHRHPELWHAPQEFLPERFIGEDDERLPFSYWPFSAGPRVCPGATLAMLEMQIVAARLIGRFEFQLVDPSPPIFDSYLTLRPRGGLELRIKEFGWMDEVST